MHFKFDFGEESYPAAGNRCHKPESESRARRNANHGRQSHTSVPMMAMEDGVKPDFAYRFLYLYRILSL